MATAPPRPTSTESSFHGIALLERSTERPSGSHTCCRRASETPRRPQSGPSATTVRTTSVGARCRNASTTRWSTASRETSWPSKRTSASCSGRRYVDEHGDALEDRRVVEALVKVGMQASPSGAQGASRDRRARGPQPRELGARRWRSRRRAASALPARAGGPPCGWLRAPLRERLRPWHLHERAPSPLRRAVVRLAPRERSPLARSKLAPRAQREKRGQLRNRGVQDIAFVGGFGANHGHSLSRDREPCFQAFVRPSCFGARRVDQSFEPSKITDGDAAACVELHDHRPKQGGASNVGAHRIEKHRGVLEALRVEAKARSREQGRPRYEKRCVASSRCCGDAFEQLVGALAAAELQLSHRDVVKGVEHIGHRLAPAPKLGHAGVSIGMAEHRRCARSQSVATKCGAGIELAQSVQLVQRAFRLCVVEEASGAQQVASIRISRSLLDASAVVSACAFATSPCAYTVDAHASCSRGPSPAGSCTAASAVGLPSSAAQRS